MSETLRLEDILSSKIPTTEAAPPAPRWLGYFEHLSATSLNMFARCPEQFRRRYILGERERPGEAAFIGSVFHKSLQFNYEQKIDSHQDRPLSEIVEYLHDEAWPTEMEKRGGPDEVMWDSEDLDEPRRTTERVTTAYTRQVVPSIQPISVEKKLIADLDGLPVPLLGYIDVDTGVVVDTKTGKQAVKSPKAQWQLQGTIYQLLARKSVEFHTISRAKQPAVYTPLEDPRLLLSYREDRMPEAVRTIIHIASQIEFCLNRYGPDEPWPTLGVQHDWACGFCGWRSSCPAWAWERA